ncbi:serine hydrolase domain-containing protein [Antricoccus suffuscus]|nr:serine hydrolase domain-containing protein [Antricoccus suffuscus]
MSSSIDAVLQGAVDAGAVPNVVAMAADRNGTIYEGAAGPRTVGQGEPVTADSLFRIASMTKMVATVAALQQLEQGKLDLDAPVEQYCPQFADVKVLDGFDADTPRLRAPATKATVRQLATHTSGLSYWFWNADIVKWEAVTGTSNVLGGKDEIFNAPMIADPGTKIEYGINIDWLGKVVEATSGESLRDYIEAHIAGPLGMSDTTFLMDEQQRARSVPIHVPGEDGAWVATDVDWNQQPDWWAGGHGLYSTPRDYLKFQQMLLGGGTFGGQKILEPATVDAAFINQVGDLEFPAEVKTADPNSSCDFNAGPGNKWGLGLMINTQQQPGMRAAGSGTWAGICNTHFWIDRDTGITGATYTQFLPFVTPASMQMYADFEKALYASL